MKQIMRYWWVPLILLVVPFLLNFLLLLPASFMVVGTETDWLSFWGGYLGAILSAIVAFYVLYKQLTQNQKQNENNRTLNKKENDANRDLQVNIIMYQLGLNNLNQLKEACLYCDKAYSYNNLCYIANMPRDDNRSIMSKIKEYMETAAFAKRKVELVEYNGTQVANDFLRLNSKLYNSYTTTLLDLETLVFYLNEDESDVINGLSSNVHASLILKPIISSHLSDVHKLGVNKAINTMINNRLDVVKFDEVEELWSKAFLLIDEEQNRLSKPFQNNI